jgi:uncharacterized protein YlxW (UPF0749 family)
MSQEAHASPATGPATGTGAGTDAGTGAHGGYGGPGGPEPRRRSWTAWRAITPVVVLLSGGLFAVSAHNSGGEDLRPGRYTDLPSLVRTERRQYDALQDRASRLKKEVDALTEAVDNSQVRALRAKARTLESPAGLVEQAGPGLTVVLSDAPDEVAQSSTQNPNLLVVHQQDIQAVANALWRGGATAVTIQGQRVVTTTGIKCIGNSVQLQGVPYAQPYTISGVGDPSALAAAVEADAYLQLYRSDAAEPDIAVGWQETVEDDIVAPAYDGLLDLSYAKPLATQG